MFPMGTMVDFLNYLLKIWIFFHIYSMEKYPCFWEFGKYMDIFPYFSIFYGNDVDPKWREQQQ